VIAAARGQYETAMKHQASALENKEYMESEGDNARVRLKLYADKKPYRE